MYLWRRLATPQWWIDHEEFFVARFGDRLAVTERVDRKRLQIEVVCDSSHEIKEFGGRTRKLPKDWFKRFARASKAKPIKIGNRKIIIPAGAAFGTGEHATTAMSLHLLERVILCLGAHAPSRAGDGAPAIATLKETFRRGRRKEHARRVRSPDLVVDLGTGSGILALAAKCLGAKRAIGIDNDPTAIATARENARRNKIDNVEFKVADVRRWKLPARIDIVTANLFSNLLIEILPKMKRIRWLIVSGILREQEREISNALKRNKMEILEARRRGKWIAIAATLG